MKVLGQSAKMREDAVALNLVEAGGAGCKACPLAKPSEETGKAPCYAMRTFKRRGRIKDGIKSRREKYGLAAVVTLAQYEVGGMIAIKQPPSWFRWSTLGAFPTPKMTTPEFWSSVTQLHNTLIANDIPVHLPIQSLTKARWVRSKVSPGITVRGSCDPIGDTIPKSHQVYKAKTPRSVVVGRPKMGRIKTLKLCEELKESLNSRGVKASLCPATKESLEAQNEKRPKRDGFKCGDCVKCADKTEEVIIYPLH
tara:strand:- start:1146 stop:1904 length:759 start_codon:yes stop_codon:yes gene_type:complete